MEAVRKHGVKLTTVLTTHHHWYATCFLFFKQLNKHIPATKCAQLTALTAKRPVKERLTPPCISLLNLVAEVTAAIFCCRDHAGGNEKMVKLMPGLKVYGGDDRVDAITKKVSHSNNLKVRLLHRFYRDINIQRRCVKLRLCFCVQSSAR